VEVLTVRCHAEEGTRESKGIGCVRECKWNAKGKGRGREGEM